MKSFKMDSFQKLFAFIVLLALLACAVGFVAAGHTSAPTKPESDNVDNPNDEIDENKDGTTPEDDKAPSDTGNNNSSQDSELPKDEDEYTEDTVNKFYNKITGLEVSEEISSSTPLGFVVNPTLQLYGISGADITVEFPTEDGTTRLLSYVTNYKALWKVGSIIPTRDFISNTSNFFGGVVISYGNDDSVKYSAWDTEKVNLDLSKIHSSYYVENTLYIYTSENLIKSELNKNTSLTKSGYANIPFIHAEENQTVSGANAAESVVIPFSQTNKTEFFYSDTKGEYLFFKSGERKVDMLNGKNVSFKNLFILFSNATTYEMASGTELVIDTTGGGSGYYITDGRLTEIVWQMNETGALEFKTLDGNILTVNRGNNYVSYYKASQKASVSFR